MMGMFWKGWSTSKSGSLVITTSALPDKANSKNILSLESRQTETWWLMVINWVCFLYACMKNSRSYVSRKYLSNFLLLSVISNSEVVGSDRRTVWRASALRTARLTSDSFKMAALINTLVSRITFIYDSSFNKSFRPSSVSPCCLAYALMSSITSKMVRLSFNIRKRVSSVTDFSASESLASVSASSSFTSKVIVFIKQI